MQRARVRFASRHVAVVASLLAWLFVVAFSARAAASEPERPWYDRIHLRGYTQLRYNRLFETNASLVNPQGDKSLGADGGFFIRRARLILFGDVAPFLGIYLQPDFASIVDESLNVGQLRDWWADLFLDPRGKTLRIRVGQQKVPYGWELMQSSQNRAPFDRSDALNSAFVNERDIGAFLYYESETARRRFRYLVDSGLKGSGDYGVAALGVSNGQPLNTRERNDNKHLFARVTYPFLVGSQIVEVATGGYTGLFVPTVTEGVAASREYRDTRVHGTFVLYPQPIGLQAEYNVGIGPEREGDRIALKPLHGGYVMGMVRTKTSVGNITPYFRIHHYDGGKKFEKDAPHYVVREANLGVEWQIQKWLELTVEGMASERTVNGVYQSGRLLRLQVQFNY